MERQVEPLAVPTHPADLSGWHSDDDREVGHVACDHCPGTYESMATDGAAAYDSAVGAERRALTHACGRYSCLRVTAALGLRTLVKTMLGPQNTSSSSVTIVIDTHIVLYRTLSPITTSLPT